MKLRLLLLIFGILTFFTLNAHAQTATVPAGSGTEADPYLIGNIENLYWLTQTDSEWDKHFEQTADIDASGSENWEDEDGKGFKPIGEVFNEFTGVYNGQGFEIDGLTILERNGFSGMFGRAKDAILMNIALVNININADSPGGIVGYLNNGKLSNSYVTGVVLGTNEVGGLSALNGGVITNSYAIAYVAGGYYTGGLVGRNIDTLSNGYFSGQTTGLKGVPFPVEEGAIIGKAEGNSVHTDLFWNSDLTNNESGIGTGLSSDEMYQQASFLNFNFSSVWQITEGSSFPSLQANTQSPAPGTTPFLLSPAPNASGITAAPSFTWAEVPGTVTYDIQISTNSDFSVITVNEPGLSDTTYNVNSDLSLGTTYFWRVRVVSSGSPQAWSMAYKFRSTSFANGSGTAEDPFLVSTAIELNGIRENLTAHYKLVNDIDLSIATGDPAGVLWNEGNGFRMIGDSDEAFNGTLDGDGYKIMGLYINSEDDAALLYIGSSGKVMNLGLENVDITSDSDAGGLAKSNDGTIKNSYTTGRVSTTDDFSQAGGLAASSSGLIDSSYSSANVSGTGFGGTGGLVGRSTGEIYNSYSTGNVEGVQYVGGLVGESSNSDIINAFATGIVEGFYGVGGLIGEDRSSDIQSSYAAGSVIGIEDVGGFIGSKNATNIQNSYYSGADNSGDETGLTQIQLRQEASYSGFDFADTWAINEGISFPYFQFSVPDQLPGDFPILTSPGNNAVNQTLTLEFDWESYAGADSYDLQIAIDRGFDTLKVDQAGIIATEYLVENDFELGTQYFWRIRANESGVAGNWTPATVFTTTFYEEGDGSEGNPYEISSVIQLDNIREDLSAHYELVSDIDLAFATSNSEGEFYDFGYGFEPIGDDDSRFQGSLDGNGYALSGLFISRNYNGAPPIGLFSVLDSSAKVLNIELLNTDIRGGRTEIGAIAGVSYGSIINSVASGAVENQNNGSVGGITGRNVGVIEHSSFAGSVTGSSTVGGLVGRNDSVITNSHSTADVDGYEYVGGLVGTNGPANLYSGETTSASIAMSYATGEVSGAGFLGGLIGKSYGEVEKSFATGNIVGDGSSITDVGGFIGENVGTITDSYSTGDITNVYASIGGFVGVNNGTITNSYSTGAPSGQNNLGGLAGNNNGTVTNSYWNTETSGMGSSSAGTGLSSADMKQESSFTGFDFSNTWAIQEGVSFPYLQMLEPEALPGYPVQQVSGKSLAFSEGEIEVPHNAVYNDLTEMTIELWVKPENVSSQKGLVEKHVSPSSGWWTRFLGNGRVQALFVTSGTNPSSTTLASLEINKWQHIAVRYDGNGVQIFIGGIEQDLVTETLGTGTVTNNTRPVRIGNLNWFNERELEGNMDEVRIWNKALTAEEIQQNMFQQLNGDEEGLIAYYPFDEIEGGITLDKTANENHGPLSSGVTQSDDTHPYGTFITGSEGWRIMSSPFADVSYGEMLDPLWTQGFPGSDSPDNGASNVYFWDEVNQQFTSISDAGDIPGKGTGFITYVYDDQDYDGTPDNFPKEIRSDSAQVSGAISPTLSFTDSGTLADDGWNLVGNPYGATINWDASSGWTTENLDATFYLWNADAGQYQSWNGATGTLSSKGLIAPWQGFWVKANAADPAITFTDEIRSAGGVFRKEAPTPELRFTIKNEQLANSTVLMLSEKASQDKDRFDAYKLQSLNANFLSLFTQTRDGAALDINALPSEADAPMVVALDMAGSNLSGRFELSWESLALPEDWSFVLTDHHTGEQINLKKQSAIEIELADAQSSKVSQTLEDSGGNKLLVPAHGLITPRVLKTNSGSATRFTLTITSQQAVSNERLAEIPTSVELQQNYPNPFNPTTTIEYGVPEAAEVTMEVFDMLGRKVSTLLNQRPMHAGRHSVQFDAARLASGMYIYRMKAGNTVITKKLTLIK